MVISVESSNFFVDRPLYYIYITVRLYMLRLFSMLSILRSQEINKAVLQMLAGGC